MHTRSRCGSMWHAQLNNHVRFRQMRSPLPITPFSIFELRLLNGPALVPWYRFDCRYARVSVVLDVSADRLTLAEVKIRRTSLVRTKPFSRIFMIHSSSFEVPNSFSSVALDAPSMTPWAPCLQQECQRIFSLQLHRHLEVVMRKVRVCRTCERS